MKPTDLIEDHKDFPALIKMPELFPALEESNEFCLNERKKKKSKINPLTGRRTKTPSFIH